MSDSNDLHRLIGGLAARSGVALSTHAEQSLIAYAIELGRWNQRINLVRFQDWRELVDRHLADGFAASLHVPNEASSLIDVGAGAGIPGALIAALRPDLEVVALEPIHKKHAFLRSLRRSAGLSNLAAHAARLEGADEPEALANRFDVAISRATWAVPTWMAKARRLVRPGGLILAMEGRVLTGLPAGAKRHTYQADGRQRAIIELRRAPDGSEQVGA